MPVQSLPYYDSLYNTILLLLFRYIMRFRCKSLETVMFTRDKVCQQVRLMTKYFSAYTNNKSPLAGVLKLYYVPIWSGV